MEPSGTMPKPRMRSQLDRNVPALSSSPANGRRPPAPTTSAGPNSSVKKGFDVGGSGTALAGGAGAAGTVAGAGTGAGAAWAGRRAASSSDGDASTSPRGASGK